MPDHQLLKSDVAIPIHFQLCSSVMQCKDQCKSASYSRTSLNNSLNLGHNRKSLHNKDKNFGPNRSG